MSANTRTIKQMFTDQFGGDPDVIARAPGRVNIIGEHTDYSGGLVLPVAIDKAIMFAARKTTGDQVEGFSLDYNDKISFQAGEFDPGHPSGWLRYVLGVLSELQIAGFHTGGFQFVVAGDVPIGAGLSSSAAIEVATCKALQGLYGFEMDNRETALLAQRAENNFVGVSCGIMDQYIITMAEAGHALKINCTDLTAEAIKVNTPYHSWLVVDSCKRRTLVNSEYNVRRTQCDRGLVAAQKALPSREIKNLADISCDDLSKIKPRCDPLLYRRVRHVVTENRRVEITARALQEGDVQAIGDQLTLSHQSLKDDFQVSCEELDLLVDIVSNVRGAAGARLTGAGFGGCIIALVENNCIGDVQKAVNTHYHPDCLDGDNKVGFWPVKISSGVELAD
ncbi:MAG: galactokinase [Halieaceae bacterium]|jgi:galactokinase|nr:galactokinase [Halieaceae bacterium]